MSNFVTDLQPVGEDDSGESNASSKPSSHFGSYEDWAAAYSNAWRENMVPQRTTVDESAIERLNKQQAVLTPSGQSISLNSALSEEDFVTAVMHRLEASAPASETLPTNLARATFDREMVARYMYYSLPENGRTHAVAAGIDLYPFLNNLEGVVARPEQSTEWWRVRADRETRGAMERLAQVDPTTSGKPWNTDETQAGLGPEAFVNNFEAERQVTDPVTGQTTTKTASEWQAMMQGTSSPKAPPIITERMQREQYTASQSEDILDLETQTIDIQSERNDMGGPKWRLERVPMINLGRFAPHAGPQDNVASTTSNVTIRESYTALQRMSESKVAEVQTAMVRAGVLDGSGRSFVPGDGWDRETEDAWRGVLAEAYRRNVSVDAYLDERIAARQAQLGSTGREGNLVMFQAAAQEYMGRKLREDEMKGLLAYLDQQNTQEGLSAEAMQYGQNFNASAVDSYLSDHYGGEAAMLDSNTGFQNLSTVVEAMIKQWGGL